MRPLDPSVLLAGYRRSTSLFLVRRMIFLHGPALRYRFHGSLRLVQGQAQPLHRTPGPRQGFGRMTAAEDDEVVGVVDDVRGQLATLFADLPVLQEAVHVEVGK